MDCSKVHIALFVPSLRGGGAERVMVALANSFSEKGGRVDLVVVEKEGPFLKDVNSRVRVVDLRSTRMIFSLPGLVKYLRRERPSVLLSALNHANIIALLALKISFVKTRIVVSEHSTLSVDQSNETRRRSKMIPLLMKRMYPSADGIVAVSAGVADDLAQIINIPRCRVSVVYNPIFSNNIPELSKAQVDHAWLSRGQPPVIMAVGRFTQAKDFSNLIRAFSVLRKKTVARLIILGEGDLRESLEAVVSDLDLSNDVAFPGFVQNPYAWMSKAALFVLSSAWEGFGNVLVEAMACGTPVVSTDCPSGPAEILENGKWGDLVPVGDINALAEAMAAALDSREHPDVAARAADFSVDQAVHGYLKAMGIEKC